MARWLGLDITPHSVRVALVSTSYRRVIVEALREERLQTDTLQSGTGQSGGGHADAHVAAMRAAVHGIRCDAIAAAMPGDRAFLRWVSLPAAAQKELSSVLTYEVEATLPFEMEDGQMDHRLLTPIRAPIQGADPEGQIPILAGVAFTEEIRERIAMVLRATGHEPQRVSVGSLPFVSLGQVCPELAKGDPVAILELEEDHMELLVLRGGEPRFTRHLSRGTSQLPADSALQAIRRELKQTLAAWRAQGGPPIDTLHVVGAARNTPGLDGWLANEIGVTAADLPRLGLEGLKPEQQAELPRYAKAIGMALSLSRRSVDLNLRQGALEAQQSFQFLREKTPLLAGLTAAIFVSLGFSIFAETRTLRAEKDILERQLEVATEARLGQKTKDVKTARQLMDDAMKGKSSDPLPDMDAFDVMVEVSKRIPKEITHDIAEFDFNRGAVSIKGIVPGIGDSATIRDNLAEHECFKNAEVGKTMRLEKQDKQKYTLEFTVDCGGGATDESAKKPGQKGAPKPKPEPKKGK